jgi:hypothetical protein
MTLLLPAFLPLAISVRLVDLFLLFSFHYMMNTYHDGLLKGCFGELNLVVSFALKPPATKFGHFILNPSFAHVLVSALPRSDFDADLASIGCRTSSPLLSSLFLYQCILIKSFRNANVHPASGLERRMPFVRFMLIRLRKEQFQGSAT